MRAGQLNKRITVQTKTETLDDFGQPIEAWVDVTETWAGVKYGKGGENFTADQTIASSAVTFRIRQRSDFTPDVDDYRISFDGKLYDLKDIREIGNNEGWEIDGVARAEGDW